MFRRTLYSAMAAVVALAIYGCSLADSPTSPQTLPPAEGSNSLLGSVTGAVLNVVSSLLVTCDKLPVQSVSQTVGKSGGTIKVGPHTLVIPAGALASNVKITAQIPGDKANTVRFYPEGLKFAQPASLTMSYANCRKLLPLPTRIVYTTDDLKILELLGSLDNRTNKTVKAKLNHFSKYAVAYRNSDVEGDEEVGFASEESY